MNHRRPFARLLALGGLLLGLAGRSAAAEIPPPLASALEQMLNERSYSWEVIHTDPPPVEGEYKTRRGTVKATWRPTSFPHINASLTSNGDLLLKREWPDGVKLDTLVTAGGQTVTLTPEGWLTGQEVLTAIAEERNKGVASPRLEWLRRADRPETRKPIEELLSVIKSAEPFEISGDTYTARLHLAVEGSRSQTDVTLIINLRGGVVRDYQLTVEGAQSLARLGIQLPFSNDRFVVMKYLPVRKLDVPDEAWEKVKSAKAAPR